MLQSIGTNQALREQRTLLKLELQDEQSTPSAEYGEVVTARWLGDVPALPDAGDDDDNGDDGRHGDQV